MIKKLNKFFESWETITAGILILAGFVVLLLIYGPLLRDEVRYQFSAKGKGVIVVGEKEQAEKVADEKAGLKIIKPVDENFGIVIPKISANTKVVAEVDPTDSKVYQRALTEGVAQAKGSAYPGEAGNIFIFAHSGADLSEAVRYNAVFYLLGNLEVGDDIFLFRNGEKFRYVVEEKKLVNSSEVQYLKKENGDRTVTLMTCWPAGTTLKRLLVIAKQN